MNYFVECLPIFFQSCIKFIAFKFYYPKNSVNIWKAFTNIPLDYLTSKKLKLGKNVSIGIHNFYAGNIEIGDYSYINLNSCIGIDPKGKISIGKYCSIACHVTILSGNGSHDKNALTTYPLFETPVDDETIIGHGVWIGAKATILSGRKVGNGAIIGANAVVTKDIPPYAIVGGNPAKIISYRFDEEKIEKIEKSKWREWTLEKLKENYNMEF